MADTHTEADQRLITAAEEMLAHHRGELELESRKQEGALGQRIKQVFHWVQVAKDENMEPMMALRLVELPLEGLNLLGIIHELLGVIDSQREALEGIKEATKCKAHYDVAYKALTLSAPLGEPTALQREPLVLNFTPATVHFKTEADMIAYLHGHNETLNYQDEQIAELQHQKINKGEDHV